MMKIPYSAKTLNLRAANFLILICTSFLLLNSLANGATRYWASSIPSNWNNRANWSATCGGAGGASVPTVNDEVVFDDGGNGNCLIDIEVWVMDLELSSSYTGSLIQISNAISISGNATFSGGSFIGGPKNIAVNGKFQLSGTNFISTSGVLDLRAEAWFGEGQFGHNKGTVRFSRQESFRLTGNNPKFYTLEIAGQEKEYTWTPVENIPKESKTYLAESPQKPSSSFTY